jgi:hypothetical protein
MIFFGLIIQNTQPHYSTILVRPLQQLQDHFLVGCPLSITTNPREKTTLYIKGLVVLIILDIGERGPTLNMKQGGYRSCHLCHSVGEYIARAVRFMDEEPQRRSFSDFEQAASKASQLQLRNQNEIVTVEGIHGLSAVRLLPFLMLPRAVTIDPMHTYSYGVCQDLLTLWISCEGQEYYINNHLLHILNQRIQSQLKLPHSEKASFPKLLSLDHLAHLWKAYDFQIFLLIYGPIVLRGILPTKYYHNFLKLSTGMRLLYKRNLTSTLAIRAKRYLDEFFSEAKNLYGPEYFTLKVHSIKHAVMNCLDFGPMPEISTSH